STVFLSMVFCADSISVWSSPPDPTFAFNRLGGVISDAVRIFSGVCPFVLSVMSYHCLCCFCLVPAFRSSGAACPAPWPARFCRPRLSGRCPGAVRRRHRIQLFCGGGG